MSPKLYLKSLNKITKRLLLAAVIIIFFGILIENPNSFTHKCVPNFRTQMGLSSEGYPYDKHFCEEGYYPQLKWGESLYDNSLSQLFFVILPVGLLLPAIFIITQRKK